jgi:Protein of unknown function, DUF547
VTRFSCFLALQLASLFSVCDCDIMAGHRVESSSISRYYLLVKCITVLGMTTLKVGGTLSTSSDAVITRKMVTKPRTAGQVIGMWWTDKEVLNSVPKHSMLPIEEQAHFMETKSSFDLIQKIRYSMLSLKGDFMDALGTTVRYDLIKQSPQYQDYLALVRQLEFVDMSTMSLQQRKAFLINTYNSLVIHALVEGLLKKFPGGTLSRLQVDQHNPLPYFVSIQTPEYLFPSTEFVKSIMHFLNIAQLYASASYNIGGDVYSLNEIENGLLRGNRLSAVPFTGLPLLSIDKRRLMLACDPRIHFALNCGAVSCPPIAVYEAESLDEQLDIATQGFLEGNTVINKEDNSVSLSMLFKWYKEDFGTSDEKITEWVVRSSPKELSAEVLKLTKPSLKFPAYNWALNDK